MHLVINPSVLVALYGKYAELVGVIPMMHNEILGIKINSLRVRGSQGNGYIVEYNITYYFSYHILLLPSLQP